MKIRHIGITVGAVVVAATVCLARPAHASQIRPNHPGSASSLSVEPYRLYNQFNNGTGYGNLSSNFGKGDSDNSQAADDFFVPKGATWAIDKVYLPGAYSQSSVTAKSWNVSFYKNTVKGKEDIPGMLIKKETLKGINNADVFFITGITGITLPAGHYWLSVQANTGSTAFWWDWGSRSVKSGSPSVWRNPGGGEKLGCTTWTNKETCFATTGRPDMEFALYGTSVS